MQSVQCMHSLRIVNKGGTLVKDIVSDNDFVFYKGCLSVVNNKDRELDTLLDENPKLLYKRT